MLKIRITYTTDKQKEDIENLIQSLENQGYEILNKSKPYRGRGESKYSNLYLDIEK